MATKKITTVPEKKGFSGLLLAKPKEYSFTPHKLLDDMGFSKDERPVFKIRPFTYLERHEVEAEQERVKAESFAWCKGKGVDPSNLDNHGLLALSSYLKSVSIGKIDKIIKACMLDNSEEFERFHPRLVDAIYSEISRISYLTEDETTAL